MDDVNYEVATEIDYVLAYLLVVVDVNVYDYDDDYDVKSDVQEHVNDYDDVENED